MTDTTSGGRGQPLPELGPRIAHARRARGLTQEQLAKLIGRPKNSVSDWERGERVPSIEVIAEIADALRVSIDDLVRGDLDKALSDQKSGSEESAQITAGQLDALRQRLGRATQILRQAIRLSASKPDGAVDFDALVDTLAELRSAEATIAPVHEDQAEDRNPQRLLF